MAAAVPIVADIFVSAVVSKVASDVVTQVAVGLGADEKTAGTLGAIGGIVAGSYSYGLASDAINAGQAASQSGMLAEQTAEFGAAGEAATSEALASNATVSSASGVTGASVNKSLMDGYQTTAPKMLDGSIQASSNHFAGRAAGNTGIVNQGNITSEVVNNADAPWYVKLWDEDTKARTVGGFVQGATGAMLQGEQQNDLYDKQRQDQIADRERLEWDKPLEFKGLPSYNAAMQNQRVRAQPYQKHFNPNAMPRYRGAVRPSLMRQRA